ncbi:hypothetical protein [Streptomyces minutiscleroticus]|uniref:Uncharacterized protein n=1 Tax=Streptomyces minutiscleroticus TaxID=68238 RepID=A0A918K756_9ACTN|nr:hypothetical protein [Streptomyces minutiscleroticus]GGX52039.1 hypothetical protein GCM10010358_02120 [Streptomyces minutiscleroticus]
MTEKEARTEQARGAQEAGEARGRRFCKACGTPAGDGGLCPHCGAVLDLPEAGGLVEDEGAGVRRAFEGRGGRH